ncbi:MAG: site-specific tyrosine recombinase/integron integrase [bacterium]
MTNSLNDAVKNFLSVLTVERNLAKRTVKAYEHDLHILRRFLEKRHKTLPQLSHIKLEDLRLFLASLQVDSGYKSTSMARKMSTLRSFFRFAVEQGFLKVDPTLKLNRTKLPRKLPTFLTGEELKRLLIAPEGDDWKETRDRAILVILAMTGIRLSELVGINVDDINFTGKNLRVLGKGSKERLIPLNETALEALRQYLDVRPLSQDRALVVNRQGRRMNGRTVEKKVKFYARKAGIRNEKISPHKLRHTFATLLHMGDVDILEIQKLLGHSNISSTTIYTHTNTEKLKTAVHKLDVV